MAPPTALHAYPQDEARPLATGGLLGVPVVLAWATFRWVSLIPQIDQRFFFTPGSPIYRAHQKIEERYEGQELLVVIAAADDISGGQYQRRIERLGDRLLELRGCDGRAQPRRGARESRGRARKSAVAPAAAAGKHAASNLILVVVDRRASRS